MASELALMDEDVDWAVTEILPQGGSFRGRDGAGEFFAGVAREWPELKVELDYIGKIVRFREYVDPGPALR